MHELIELGVDLARMVHAQAKTACDADAAVVAAPGAMIGAAAGFDRIARAVRRTVALAQRLDESARVSDGARRALVRRRIIRDVEDSIQRCVPGEAGERLEAELFERLDGPEMDAEIDHRPDAEIIADICRDLGLATPPGAHPWKRRTPANIAALCARVARVGSGGAGAGPEGGVPDGAGPAARPFMLVAWPAGG